jgi:hypothetical protein
MRTEEHLHSALALLEEQADSYRADVPAPEVLTSPRAHRSKLVVSVLATAAAVAAIAVAAPLLGHDRASAPKHQAGGPTRSASSSPTHHHRPKVASRAPTSFDLHQYYFTIDKMNGFSINGGVSFPDLQQAELDTGDGGHYDLTVNARGAWRPHRPAGARPVTVNGHPGFYGVLYALPMGVAAMRPVGLAWQYAPHAWATVVSWNTKSIPLDRATLIADAVHPGALSPLTVPVSTSPLPAGLRLAGSLCGAGGSRAGQHGYRGFDCLIDFDSTRTGPTLTIDVTGPGMGYQKTGRQVRINGRPAYVTRDVVLVVGSDFVASIQQLPAQPSGRFELTEAQLLQIAHHLKFVPRVSDYADWTDATTALP